MTLAVGESPPLDDAALCARVLEVLRSEPEREDYRELPVMLEAGAVSAAQHRAADEYAQGNLRGRRAAADRSRVCGGSNPRLGGSASACRLYRKRSLQLALFSDGSTRLADAGGHAPDRPVTIRADSVARLPSGSRMPQNRPRRACLAGTSWRQRC